MYCLRRAAFRAPTAPFLLKPRSITTVTPSALRINRQIPNLAFQRRWSSDEGNASSTGVYDGSALFSEAESGSSNSSVTPRRTIPRETSGGSSGFRGPARSARRPVTPAAPNETVYVGNLFFDITAEDLKGEMQKFGTVQSTRIVYDNRGLSKGFGYVTYDSVDAATKAIEGMHQQVYEGRRINVHYATVRVDRQPTAPSQPPSKTLFIGNMSFEMTDADLNALFKDIRNVIDVRVAVDRKTGTPRGFAHADFVDVHSAVQAQEQLKDKAPYGRRLRLDYSFNNRRNDDNNKVEEPGSGNFEESSS